MPRNKPIAPARYLQMQNCPDLRIRCTYDEHATLAFNITFKEICELENPRRAVAFETSMAAPAVAYWFLTLESFLNANLTIFCTLHKLSSHRYLNLSVTQKLISIIDIMSLDKLAFNENEVIARVHELAQFRNVLFTERQRPAEMYFRKTCFSAYPLHAQLNDVFETLDILLEVIAKLKVLHAGVKIEPEILLSNSDAAVREPLDVCFHEILRPCFDMALLKSEDRNTMFCLNKINSFLSKQQNA
jgi:hypothetical protein